MSLNKTQPFGLCQAEIIVIKAKFNTQSIKKGSDIMKQTQITNEDKKKIIDLYFNKMYNYEELEIKFRHKYTYRQFKSVIDEHYKNYKGHTYN